MTNEMTIEPQALLQMMPANGKFFLLDCRETWEYQTARIDGATLIPMGAIPQNIEQIPPDVPVIVYCHHGMRSLDVAIFLKSKGVEARSLSGGIDRWSQEIDASIPRY
jgi:rhodanese-related sulfurtransferase